MTELRADHFTESQEVRLKRQGSDREHQSVVTMLQSKLRVSSGGGHAAEQAQGE